MAQTRTRTRAAYALSILVFLAILFPFLAGCAQDKSAASLTENYLIEVELTGGSGRASLVSPCSLKKEGDTYTATLVWSSSNYDKMTVDGVDYKPTTTDPGSTFEVPVTLDTDMSVSAETLAMSEAHTIEYTIRFDSSTMVAADSANTASGSSADANAASSSTTLENFHNTDIGCDLQPVASVELSYATHFTIDEYEGGYKLICVSNGERYLTVPEGAQVPDGLSADIAVIKLPANKTYLVSSSTMCLVDALGAIGNVSMTSLKADDCSVQGFVDALNAGTVVYGGKYSAPDYERIAQSGVTLAVENNMINHTPDVKEKLQDLGVVVLTEQSSLESTVLGRIEWVKLYGALFGCEDKANQIFDEQRTQIETIAAQSEKSAANVKVAYFYINSNGAAVTRRSGDYVAQMIRLAGGIYALDDASADSSSSGSSASVTLEMEQFFALARDADVVVYSSSIDDSVHSLDDLVGKNSLLSQFKAVQNGNVWLTGTNIYQQMTSSAQIITELSQVIQGSDGQGFTQLTRLK